MRYAALAAPRTTRVLLGRAGSAEVSNIPATTVVPRSRAAFSTASANGPGSGSANGLTSEPGSPKSRANASGRTTRSASCGTRSASRARLAAGSSPDASWTTATRSSVASVMRPD